MEEKNKVTILHLSDLQFGKNHRFGSTLTSDDSRNNLDSLSVRLIDDVQELLKSHISAIDVVTITGDLTEMGKQSEFQEVVIEIVPEFYRVGKKVRFSQ